MVAVAGSREDIVEEIKERADIVQIIGEHVNLKRSGVRYLGICPFHHEKTPSFSVHSGQQFFHCFGCKESGDVFSFVMKYHNLDFPGALKMLAQRYQIELPERRKSKEQQELDNKKQQLFAVNQKTTDLYREYLLESKGAAKARAYLEKRGIGSELQARYQLGCAPDPDNAGWNFLGSQLDRKERFLAIDLGLLAEKQQGGTYDRFRNRIMFPIFDSRGRVAGFGGRVLDNGNPKYLNSPESITYNKSRLLFGLFHQRDAIRKLRQAVIVEGNFDLLSLIAHGFEPVVAPLGTALTKEQIRMLKPLADEVVLLFDGDEAGVKAAERSVALFLEEQVSGRVAVLPKQHDPDTFVRQNDLEALKNLVNRAESLPEFVLDRLVARYGLTLDGKGKIVEELKPLMTKAGSTLQRSMWAAHFGEILGIDPAVILKQSSAPERVPDPIGAQARGPQPPRPQHYQPISGSLKAIVTYMVLHPEHCQALEEGGVSTLLDGTIGEVILLQLRVLSEMQQVEIHPEDLLTVLPEGEERSLVASLLSQARDYDTFDQPDDKELNELEEILKWLRLFHLQKRSDRLMTEINEAQKHNDFSKISDLMREKMSVDGMLKNRAE